MISHAVYLYYRFTLSFHDIEELLAVRGIQTSYKSIRRWCLKFPRGYTKALHKRPGVSVKARPRQYLYYPFWLIV